MEIPVQVNGKLRDECLNEQWFETLAQAVTRDVHPRALLEELLRLNR